MSRDEFLGHLRARWRLDAARLAKYRLEVVPCLCGLTVCPGWTLAAEVAPAANESEIAEG
jgi:hypothetical protein